MARTAALQGLREGIRPPLGAATQDVARTVLHPASDASAFMTGRILRPNGGATMPW
ncbi:hypothetical protein [Streptomyces sp. NPDC052042]|uniref:hypothetical protein n=1 Tax=Streptomyces sp. NPDC052042 TaxID=3365683 RepID=UPI0037CDAC5A